MDWWTAPNWEIVPGTTPLTSLSEIVAVTAAYLLVTYVLLESVILRGRGDKPVLAASKTLSQWNNLFYGAVSLALAAATGYAAIADGRTNSVDDLWCTSHQPSSLMHKIRYVFLLSKVYEMLDMVLVLLGGSQGIVTWHFRFHHATTLLTAWMGLSQPYDVPTILANAGHHAVMYPYLGGLRFLGPLLPFTGALQLLSGLAVTGGALWRRFGSEAPPCGGSAETDAFLLAMYLAYFCLFLWTDVIYPRLNSAAAPATKAE